tara:strand:- start:2551 stop:4479 length:1929 start_codon:yes stop_codon:yes gene_type:complete
LTKRALIIGLVMAVWVSLWPAYSSMIVRSSRADFAHLSVAFLIPFVCLLGFNLFLDRKGRALRSSELLGICCIGMLASNMQGEWLAGYFLGTISSPTYFATPENRWEELLLTNVPPWTIVSGLHSTTGFYEGLLSGDRFPWLDWLRPLLSWGSLLAAILTANLCTMVILRKQWMEHEKLTFPIAVALLELTGTSNARSTVAGLVRSRLFQMGFLVVFVLFCWNIASWFYPVIPQVPIMKRLDVYVWQSLPPLWIVLHPMSMTFAYFTKSDVLLSIWVFQLLAFGQAAVFDRIGFTIGESDRWSSLKPAIGWQSFGGMILFVGWGLWMARSHLGEVWKRAVGKRSEVDDSGELLSYRTSVWLLIGSVIFAILFLRSTGMGWGPTLAFWFATTVLYIGLARIIVESGLVFLRGPITAQIFAWHLFGITGMGPQSAAALTLTYTFFCDAKTFGMTTFAHIPRLTAAMDLKGRRLVAPGVLLGALLGAGSVIAFILYKGYYTIGAYNFGVVSFNGSINSAIGLWQTSASRIIEGTGGTDWKRLQFLGIGGAVTGFLLYLRYRFPGFPIHPIGFTISSSEILRSNLFTIFTVWLVKTILLGLGGLDRYHRTVPLFLGMLVGHLAGLGLGVIVDFFWFHGEGHPLNRW